jgi:NDP-sugar pyrophosphorylase family protein
MPSASDVIVLCGGAGVRLKSVTGDAPKSLATIGGRPFLELLLAQLRRHQFERAILAVGYQKELIQSHFGSQAYGLNLEYSVESVPLGTGGALRNASDMIESENVLIMNGDSYTDADLMAFALDFQAAKADVSMLVVPADGRTDCGLVSVGVDRTVTGFVEKGFSAESSYVNAGIYMATKHTLCGIESGFRISLEQELFPRWLAGGKRLRAFIHSGTCVDIGTPERYRSAQDSLAQMEN